MLFGRLNEKRVFKKIKILVLSVLSLLLIFSLAACGGKGSIVILEDGHGTGFTMTFKDYDSSDKCELSLEKGDVVKITIERQDGRISYFSMDGKKGSQPYIGNNLESREFTVTVQETDRYVFRIAGKDATGKITVKNLSGGN